MGKHEEEEKNPNTDGQLPPGQPPPSEPDPGKHGKK